MPWSLVKAAGPVDIIGQVRRESIVVNEAGPGGVSSMSFTCLDPTKARTFTRREEVVYQNPAGITQFRGYVENVTSRPVAIGREIDVECTGPEAILDWLIGPLATTVLAGTNFPNAIAQIVTAKTGGFTTTISANRTGDAANPIGSFVRPAIATAPFLTGGVNWLVPIGTLRQQIEWLNRKCSYNLGGGAFSPFNTLLTVDMTLGLRAWEDDITLQPTDYTTLTVVDTGAGAIRAEDLQATKDWTATIDRVAVQGTGPAIAFRPAAFGSFPHREALLTDAQINTVNERDTAGDSYLISHGAEDRGEFDILDFTPVDTVHAGSLLDLTDAMTGATGIYRIMEIRKTYNASSRQNWHVTYGRLAPSFARLIPTTGTR